MPATYTMDSSGRSTTSSYAKTVKQLDAEEKAAKDKYNRIIAAYSPAALPADYVANARRSALADLNRALADIDRRRAALKKSSKDNTFKKDGKVQPGGSPQPKGSPRPTASPQPQNKPSPTAAPPPTSTPTAKPTTALPKPSKEEQLLADINATLDQMAHGYAPEGAQQAALAAQRNLEDAVNRQQLGESHAPTLVYNAYDATRPRPSTASPTPSSPKKDTPLPARSAEEQLADINATLDQMAHGYAPEGAQQAALAAQRELEGRINDRLKALGESHAATWIYDAYNATQPGPSTDNSLKWLLPTHTYQVRPDMGVEMRPAEVIGPWTPLEHDLIIDIDSMLPSGTSYLAAKNLIDVLIQKSGKLTGNDLIQLGIIDPSDRHQDPPQKQADTLNDIYFHRINSEENLGAAAGYMFMDQQNQAAGGFNYVLGGMAENAANGPGGRVWVDLYGNNLNNGRNAKGQKSSSYDLPDNWTLAGQWDAGQAAGGAGKVLPNVEQVIVDSRKVTEYALNPNNTSGGADKAKVFQSALGYTQSNASHLIQQIQRKLPTTKAIWGKLDEYGQRFTVDIPITGPNGKTAIVRTGWILEPDSQVPRMTTIFVK